MAASFQRRKSESVSKLIAVLFLLGQFEVAVETSRGYFVATYPDTEEGVVEFLNAIRPALASEAGRFYACVAYDGPVRDLLDSPLARRIGVALNLRTRLADPGVADAQWIVRNDHIARYFAGRSGQKLDAKAVEKVCVSLLPRAYMKLYPAKAGVTEFYRR